MSNAYDDRGWADAAAQIDAEQRGRLAGKREAATVLAKWLVHAQGCGHWYDRKCTCGLSAALEALKAHAEGKEER